MRLLMPRHTVRSARRLVRLAVVACLLAVAMLVVQQSGVLQRIPDAYMPDALEQYVGTSHETMLANAYLYQQQRPLSCEYASTSMAANMGGWNISEYDFDALVPLSENPHQGYRGNILGEWGNTTDYGVYAEPLHDALAEMGIPSTVFYASGDPTELKHELQDGNAVVVWLAMRGEINSYRETGVDGSSYQLTQYMHVMTVYGFDDEGVYLSDPGTAVWRFYDWDTFMQMWNVMDGMSLSVPPRTTGMGTDTFPPVIRYHW